MENGLMYRHICALGEGFGRYQLEVYLDQQNGKGWGRVF